MKKYAELLAIAALILLAALFFGSAAFRMGSIINAPHVKTNEELCAEHDGRWIHTKSGSLCFSKDAFK